MFSAVSNITLIGPRIRGNRLNCGWKGDENNYER